MTVSAFARTTCAPPFVSPDDTIVPETGWTDPTDPAWGPFDGIPVVLYLRISEDKYLDTDAEAKGVRRQFMDGKIAAHQRGLRIVAVRVDNDYSAFKRHVIRPGFELMITELTRRVVRGFIVADLDRLMRQNRDLERVIDIYETRQEDEVLISAILSGEINLSDDNGIVMARMLVTMANKASKDTARRMKNWHKWTASEGISVGGRRAFGWGVELEAPDGTKQWDKSKFNLPEKRAIEVAAEDMIKSTADLSTIARRWNALGLFTPAGKRWRAQSVRQVLASPKLAGYRVVKKKIAIDPRTGEKVFAKDHEPILTVEVWEALQKALVRNGGIQAGHHNGGGRRRAIGGGRSGFKYLLAGGLLTCHRTDCGKSLSGNRDPRAPGGFYYKCPCGKSSVPGGPTDDVVVQLFTAWAGNHGRVEGESVATEWPRQAELDEALNDLASFEAKYKSREWSARVALPFIDEANARIAELQADREKHAVTAEKSAVTADLLDALEKADTPWDKSAILRQGLVTIVVWPAKHRGYKGPFDVKRLDPVFVPEA